MGNETTDIEEALRSGAVRLVPVEPNDKMMVMGGFRFAGKVPNSLVFKEVRKGWDDMLSQAPDHTPALLALIEERDRLRVERDACAKAADDWVKAALAAEAKCDALREALALAAEDFRTIKTLNSHGASDQTYIGWLRSNAEQGERRARSALIKEQTDG